MRAMYWVRNVPVKPCEKFRDAAVATPEVICHNALRILQGTTQVVFTEKRLHRGSISRSTRCFDSQTAYPPPVTTVLLRARADTGAQSRRGGGVRTRPKQKEWRLSPRPDHCRHQIKLQSTHSVVRSYMQLQKTENKATPSCRIRARGALESTSTKPRLGSICRHC